MRNRISDHPVPPSPAGDASFSLASPEVRHRLPVLLRRAWYGLNQAFRRRCMVLGITPDQFTALRTLLEGDAKGMTQKQLVEAMSSDPNTITSLLNRMEQNGWLTRNSHELDRRAHRLVVTVKGRHIYNKAKTIADALQKEIIEVLPSSRRQEFLDDLAMLAEQCHEFAARSVQNGRLSK